MEGGIMADLRLSGLGGGGIPSGETADRPASPEIGDQFYNGTLGVLEIYTASGWLPATGANDFNVTLNGTVTTATFTKEYFAGAYTISSALLDSTYDIYVYSTDGTLAGYTKAPSLTATGNFNKIVVIGGSTGDLLSFSYKTTFIATETSSEVTAGPYISSISSSSLTSLDSTTTVTGGNFATDVAVNFTGTGYSSTPAKSVVRNSSSELVVTRPDNFPPSGNPYTMTITNPSVSYQPTGSNLHKATISAGGAPVWVNSSGDNAITLTNTGWSYTLVATDADGSITYSIVTGTLPSGAALNSSTGVISSTNTLTSNVPLTVRATDTGGNTANLTINLLAPIATGGTITTSGAYKIHTFTSSGSFVSNFKGLVEILAVGGGGGGSNIIGGGGGAGGMLDTTTTLSSAGTYAVAIGAGGRGGYGYNSLGYTGSGAKGDNTTFNSVIAYGGGGALAWSALGSGLDLAACAALTAGGSGAGGSANMNLSGGSYPAGQQLAGIGVSGQGNNGGVGGDDAGSNREIGGGGGGAGAAGTTGYNSTGNGGAGRASSITGSSVTYAGGGGAGRRWQSSGNGPSSGGSGGGGNGATGSGGGSNGSTNLGGGGGGGNYPGVDSGSLSGGSGGSGIFVVRYKVS